MEETHIDAQNLQESQEVKRVNNSEEQNLQLSSLQEMQEQTSSEEVFHEVGSRTQKWLINQGKHDAIAEEVIELILTRARDELHL
jgi:hypothetical protein